MGRPSRKLEQFVELYVNGPEHLRGQWNRCAVAAGLHQVPNPDDPMVRRKIKAAGGTTPTPTPTVASVDALTSVLTKLDVGIPWKEIRADLASVIKDVANGTVQARAAQVSMLKYVIEKAEAASAEEEEVHGVVLLPTTGSNAELKIDEEWVRKIKAMETPND